MQFYSLKKQSPEVNFKEATISGQAPDGGLYFPATIPKLSAYFLNNIIKYSDEAIAYEIINPYAGDCFPGKILKGIIEESLNFKIPLVPVSENIFSLELFHGPTLAFKDVGARFMSRSLGYFLKDEQKKVTVLVATSGDTGGAVAHGFLDIPNIDVVILYPSGKISPVQEKQLTTLGKNIHALEVNGSFDDCQQMVKEAFSKKDNFKHLLLTSANSINVARWLPQQFYYFFAYKQWADKKNLPVVAVPSGNFGNICAGLLAQASGLPVKHFIAACNANDVVHRFLYSGKYEPKETIATMSNAMDVGDPSNFVRILEIFQQQLPDLKEKLSAFSISEKETKATLKKVFKNTGYILDPHGAVAYCALEKYFEESKANTGYILETAHPVKFAGIVQDITGSPLKVPYAVQDLFNKPKQARVIEKGFSQLQDFLLEMK